jgi:hypothetical protein
MTRCAFRKWYITGWWCVNSHQSTLGNVKEGLALLIPFIWMGTMIDSYSSGNSSLFQIELINLCISERNVLPPALISSAGIWSILGDLYSFSFYIAIWNWNALGSGTMGSAVFISFCLTSLTTRTLSSWEKWFLHLSTLLWQSVNISPFSSFLYYF